LLDHIFGAQLHFTGPVTYEQVNAEMESVAARLRTQGRHPLVIPLGGATALGTAGYVQAVMELAAQCMEIGVEPGTIVLAAGSGSTLAGIQLGATLCLPGTRVVGVSVSWPEQTLQAAVSKLISETAELLGLDDRPAIAALDIRGDFIGAGYTVATDGGKKVLASLARTEGVLLDLTYTAKAAYGLVDLLERGVITPPVVFWHTGGVPDLFTRSEADVPPREPIASG
jgi:1-aminocyclopropane-1-carboxylate deaminase/D-cysteine desulfhydrase-like pyridoxal-dependent ACC family enzyme